MPDLAQSLNIGLFVAVCLLLMAGFPVAFTLAGTAFFFALIGIAFGVFDSAFLTAFPQRIFGTMTNEVLVAVPLFIFMGVMLERSKVAEELLETMGVLFGRLRGGLGISVTLVGALLAASTGIVGATVVTMGLLSLPTMLKRGYDPRLSCGSIAAAGTLGQIIPPSIVLIVLGDQLSSAYQKAQLKMGQFSPDTVSVGDLFAGALLPGLLLVVFYIAYQILIAIRRPETSPAMHEVGGGISAARLFMALLPPVALIVAVLGSILGGIATPTEAASVGAVGAILLAGHRLRRDRALPTAVAAISLVGVLVLTSLMDLRIARESIPATDRVAIALAILLCLGVFWGVATALARTWSAAVLRDVVRSTARFSAMIFSIVIGAALFGLVFRGLGGEGLVHGLLNAVPGGTAGAILAVMVLMFLLGFFLDFLEIVFVVVPLIAPALLAMEMPDGTTMSPVWLGVLMAVNLQTSFLTPPFGFALFYLRGVAPPQVRTTDIYRGIAPFVLIQLLVLAVLWFAPGLATWLPAVVYGS